MGGRHQVLGFLLFCQAASIEDKRQSQISEKRPHGAGVRGQLQSSSPANTGVPSP